MQDLHGKDWNNQKDSNFTQFSTHIAKLKDEKCKAYHLRGEYRSSERRFGEIGGLMDGEAPSWIWDFEARNGGI